MYKKLVGTTIDHLSNCRSFGCAKLNLSSFTLKHAGPQADNLQVILANILK